MSNRYGFLFALDATDIDGTLRHRTITCAKLNTACSRMCRTLKGLQLDYPLLHLDYEVSLGDEFIDLHMTDHPITEFLERNL